jgi:hypothetical protein
VTKGKIHRLPTSAQDACVFVKELKEKEKQGEDFVKKWTGLDADTIEDLSCDKFGKTDLQRLMITMMLSVAGNFLNKKTKGFVKTLVIDGSWKTGCLGVEAQDETESDKYEKCHQPCEETDRECGVPTKSSMVKPYMSALMKKAGLGLLNKYTGITLESAPKTQKEVKQMLFEMPLSFIKPVYVKWTKGVIYEVPASLERAQKLAKHVLKLKGLKSAGKLYLKRYTGLPRAPKNEKEWKQVVLYMIMKIAIKSVTKLLGVDMGAHPKIPVDAMEGKKFLKKLIMKKGLKYLEKYTGLTAIPKKFNFAVASRIGMHMIKLTKSGNLSNEVASSSLSAALSAFVVRLSDLALTPW